MWQRGRVRGPISRDGDPILVEVCQAESPKTEPVVARSEHQNNCQIGSPGLTHERSPNAEESKAGVIAANDGPCQGEEAVEDHRQ